MQKPFIGQGTAAVVKAAKPKPFIGRGTAAEVRAVLFQSSTGDKRK